MTNALFSAKKGDYATPPEIISRVKLFFGGEIELDPATSVEANKIVGAKKIFTVADNGLQQKWHGKVFINPPGSCAFDGEKFVGCSNEKVCACKLVPQFWEKLSTEYGNHRVSQAIWLGFSLNQLATLQALKVPSPMTKPICILRNRLAFIDTNTGQPVPSPTQFNWLALFGDREQAFRDAFGDLGSIK